jgi:DNA anti-recombination protein RmuC
VGVIAEEVAEVLPEVVAFEADGRARGVNYGKLVSVLIEATKTQQQTIEQQQQQIEALEDRMTRLEQLIQQQTTTRASRASSGASDGATSLNDSR